MRGYRLYVLDLDGTLYRGERALPGAVDAVAELRRRGALVRFLTNNSALTRVAVATKLQQLGFQASPEETLTSGDGAARLLIERGLKSAFVVGDPGLAETLSAAGLTLFGPLPLDGGESVSSPTAVAPAQAVANAREGGQKRAPQNSITLPLPPPIKGGVVGSAQPDAVVVGICRSLSYDLLDQAMNLILRGALFVATNRDATYPLEDGCLSPGAGAIVAALEACTGVSPVVVGKPEPTLILQLLEEIGVEPEAALVVGDRVETDLEAGRRAGCDTHLVLTGVTTEPHAGQGYSADLGGLLE
ncbi:MAG: HAD-IIA family hydrolase [Fimbriimonas ginsengisoli]|uniref:HAD-IIA family hydrolase n=1 Tax=Fimbriimonas ginsengisoli TaxID=1005039 RepID=A0A931PWQ6_FIMGI|nr:HAD-IIA family hydrolase [Fimbriimonas ginsengisoli]